MPGACSVLHHPSISLQLSVGELCYMDTSSRPNPSHAWAHAHHISTPHTHRLPVLFPIIIVCLYHPPLKTTCLLISIYISLCEAAGVLQRKFAELCSQNQCTTDYLDSYRRNFGRKARTARHRQLPLFWVILCIRLSAQPALFPCISRVLQDPHNIGIANSDE